MSLILKIFSPLPSKKFRFVIHMVEENPEGIKKCQFRVSRAEWPWPGSLGSSEPQRQQPRKQLAFILKTILLPRQGS